MQQFTKLYQQIDQTTKTTEKVAAMADYFRHASPTDAAWAVFFLSGQKLQRLVNPTRLREWAAELADLPLWLLEESYEWVGDLAETLATIIPFDGPPSDEPLHVWVTQKLLPLRAMGGEEQKTHVIQYWRDTDTSQRFLLNKLITGSFRVGVSQSLLVRALSQSTGVSVETLSHRLMGSWQPTEASFTTLIDADNNVVELFQPYPFCLAHPIEGEVEDLGPSDNFLIEWKWDGIRAQVIRRSGQLFVWSRGEERIEDRFPELKELLVSVPNGTVLDGEILGWKLDKPLPFADLQRRIGRKTVGKKLMSDVPIKFLAFDILEHNHQDVRHEPIRFRRQLLEQVVTQSGSGVLNLSPQVTRVHWDDVATDRQSCRDVGAEGLMLKELHTTYTSGRTRGVWWKWKIEPFTIDAVLTAAQRGHGRRASLYSDYTFSLWQGDHLVPFAKAYSGLTDAEIRQVDQFVRQNTLERYGPVRTVTPSLVMEIAFENLQISKRHKSGIAVRFPRILRWRHDKRIEDANKLDDLFALHSSS